MDRSLVMAIDDGGQAFPGTAYGGLTKRDYFAAKAMQALLTSTNSEEMMKVLTANANFGGYKGREDEFLAVRSYQLADVMIIERSKQLDSYLQSLSS
jgi:hypothetical protein